MRDDNRRVVVTGIGVVAPGGTESDEFFDRVVSGKSAIRTISSFDPSGFRSQIAAECDFTPDPMILGQERVENLDRATQFALTCLHKAVADSGLVLPLKKPDRVGVALGSAVGCTTRLEQEYLSLSENGRYWNMDGAAARPELYDYVVPSSIAAEVASEAGVAGPVAMISTGCTSGLDAIGHACNLIHEGSADVVLAGGTDAPISPITVACFDAIRATSARNADPQTALRPFDRSRDGFVLGEGAAMLVLEDLAAARGRGAPILGEISGFATRSNAYRMTALRPDGVEMATAISYALEQAGVLPESVDWVNAHGTATNQNDIHETAAVKRSLGHHAYRVPMSSIKPVVGHSLGAIGSIETVACVLALKHNLVPPTANLWDVDPALDLDYVPREAREARLNTVLTVGSGFGGFQSALVLQRVDY